MPSSKLTVVSIALSLTAILAGCAEATPEELASGGDPAAALSGAEDSKIGTTSSAMTVLALCASGTDPNALGNLEQVGDLEEFVRSKATIGFCELGTKNRREAIVDFSIASQAKIYEFVAAPNMYKAPNKVETPKDMVTCGGFRLEAKLEKLVAGKYEPIGPKVVKTGKWTGSPINGSCELPTHVFTRNSMVDSATAGAETSKYRVTAKVESLAGIAEAVYIRGRNLGGGY